MAVNYPLKADLEMSRKEASLLTTTISRIPLSSFAKVLEWSERWSIGGVEVDFEPSEHGLGRLL